MPDSEITGGDYETVYEYVGVFTNNGDDSINEFTVYVTPHNDTTVTFEHPANTLSTQFASAGRTLSDATLMLLLLFYFEIFLNCLLFFQDLPLLSLLHLESMSQARCLHLRDFRFSPRPL